MRGGRPLELDDVDQLSALVLRLAVGSLFLAAAVRKLQGGGETIQKTVRFFRTTFENTWLPEKLVTAHVYATPFVETLIVVWLISGFRLRAAWVFAALFTASLAFGMSVAGKFNTAADNYTYVLNCCAGLLRSRCDRVRIDALWKRDPTPCSD
ncbi:MAG: MauE/DoxX family redox-associated membrane protein [Planctomycetota bacterium]